MNKKGVNKKRKYKNDKTINKKNDIIFWSIIMLFFIVVLSFIFSSKTFFKRAYENKNIIVNVPLLTFFISDSNNVLELKSTRSIQYLNQFYEKNILKSSKFTEYSCNDKQFLYNPDTQTLIYSIEIIKGKSSNIIKVHYSDKSFEEICFENES